MLKIIGIKTNDGFYITDNINADSYFNSQLKDKVINKESLLSTFNKDWFKTKDEPISVERYVAQPSINKRYELRDKSLSGSLKDIYKYEDVFIKYDNDYSKIFVPDFEKIMPLYDYIEDKQSSILEPIDFEYETITKIKEIKTPEQITYKTYGEWGKVGNRITNENIKADMISLIITPKVLIHEAPSYLSRKDTYDIIRAHIKDNINPKVAEITSDYDFCFTVVKKIKLAKEHVYKVDINDNFFGLLGRRKKKPKYETRVQKTRKVQVFEMCHNPYQGYTPIEPFSGENQDDLKRIIDNYLSHIISVINEPLCECDKCNGTGVLLNE